jgi:hypothetical protein
VRLVLVLSEAVLVLVLGRSSMLVRRYLATMVADSDEHTSNEFRDAIEHEHEHEHEYGGGAANLETPLSLAGLCPVRRSMSSSIGARLFMSLPTLVTRRPTTVLGPPMGEPATASCTL